MNQLASHITQTSVQGRHPAHPRILHMVHQYPPEHVGGTELYTQAVAQALQARGFPVSVFTRLDGDGSGHAARDEADLAVHVAWSGELSPVQRFLATFGNGNLAASFAQTLDRFQPDLVHIQHLMGLPTALIDMLAQRGIPYLVTLHDFWWVCANAQLVTNYSGEVCDGPKLWLNCARCAVARSQTPLLWPAAPGLALMLAHRGSTLSRVLERAAAIIAPTRFVKDWYARHGVDPAKIQVLPHGIERPAHAADQAQPAHEQAVRFFYAGGLTWQKGVHVLLEAFLATDGPGELWLAGDEAVDPGYTQSLRRMKEQSPHKKVSFLGKLNRAQFWQALTQADVVTVPALWYETFSLFIHEAFALGRPVIASNLGALAEAVTPGVNGLLIAPGQVGEWRATLQSVVDQPQQLRTLGQGVTPPLTLNEHLHRLEAVYRAALRG